MDFCNIWFASLRVTVGFRKHHKPPEKHGLIFYNIISKHNKNLKIVLKPHICKFLHYVFWVSPQKPDHGPYNWEKNVNLDLLKNPPKCTFTQRMENLSWYLNIRSWTIRESFCSGEKPVIFFVEDMISKGGRGFVIMRCFCHKLNWFTKSHRRFL